MIAEQTHTISIKSTDTHQVKDKIQAELVRQIFSALNTQIITSLILAAILADMQRYVIALTEVIVWCGVIMATSLSRYGLLLVYKRLPMAVSSQRWLALLRLGTALSGLAWGSASFFLFPVDDPQYQLFLMFMLAGLTAGGVASYSIDLPSSTIFSLSVLLPLIFRLFSLETGLNVPMGMAVSLYLSFMLMISRNINRNAFDNIVLRIQAVEREEIVKASEERYRLLLNHAPIGIIHYDAELTITYVNHYFAALMRNTIDGLIGIDMKRLKDTGLLPTMKKALEAEVGHYEGYYSATYSPVQLCISMTCAPFQDDKGHVLGGIAIIQDITESKHDADKLRIAATAFEVQEGMIVTDANCAILQINRTFSTITGYSAEDIVGKNMAVLDCCQPHMPSFLGVLDKLQTADIWEGEIWSRRKNGEVYPGQIAISAVKNPEQKITNYVATFTDITQRKIAEEEINSLAFYDPLTKLPNRRLLNDRISQALSSSVRTGREGALLLIDLDNFKTINDTLGHDAGDLLLQQVAQRLLSCVREGDTVARLGGDEFVVMLEDLSTDAQEAAEQTERVGEKIIATLGAPYLFGNQAHYSTPSIGVTLFTMQHDAIDVLFKQADIAMYQAKKAGKNTLRFFDQNMQETINERVAIESELRKALENGQLHLYYQIQVDETYSIYGAESLIRWIHPELGLIMPEQFISLAEETGLIIPIGRWGIEMACAQLKAWEADAVTRDLVLSINVSSVQFHQADFVSHINSAVAQYAINPKRLCLELTESLLIDNVGTVIAIMQALKTTGVQFSLDDFGTGYSSLQYLKQLPLDRIKIDKSFVHNIIADNNDKVIVKTIISMAKNLNLQVVAEGVETEEQRRFLLENGCTHYQGYLFGKPVPDLPKSLQE